MEKIIKSKERVKKLAEVYTPGHIVDKMIDIIPQEIWLNHKSTFLEPACGNGNFVIAILDKKLKNLQELNLKHILEALSSIYGIDICPDNIIECKIRLKEYLINSYDYLQPYRDIISDIVDENYIVADFLNGREDVVIINREFIGKNPSSVHIKKQYFNLNDIYSHNAESFKTKIVKYNYLSSMDRYVEK